MPATRPQLSFRPLVREDVGRVPGRCQGSAQDLLARIADLGAAAILAFDGVRHVAQLQFRRYEPALRSPDGIWDPAYWGDFGAQAPALPEGTLAIYCYHVGQLDDTEARDPRYHGLGIATALLDELIAWASRQGIPALVAKATPAPRPVMSFMGGLSAGHYASRGFVRVAEWLDPELLAAVRERGLVAADFDPAAAATVGCCIKRL